MDPPFTSRSTLPAACGSRCWVNLLALGLLTWALVWVVAIGTVMFVVAVGLDRLNGEKIARYLSKGRDPDKSFVTFIENLL